MFGRGGRRPGSGRPKLIKTPIKKIYKSGSQVLYRRRVRAKYFALQKELIDLIKRGDSSSAQYEAVVAEHKRICGLLGLQKSTAEPRDLHGSPTPPSDDEVKIEIFSFLAYATGYSFYEPWQK